ncbi:MAG: PEP-CTERM sorting domain-containing protein [Phycisphaerales bacterium JB038]
MRKTLVFAAGAIVLLSGSAFAQYLAIPDSTSDTIGMYDPFDGTYMGVVIDGDGMFSTPINAILGPDNLIYVSDQIEDSVFRFDMAGNFVDVYADATDGLNNIRGIDFYDGKLFVTSGDDYVATFDGPHNRLGDFINDGSDPFDILFLDDGSALLSDIAGTTDNVRLYNPDGSLNAVLFDINFPEQVQVDSSLPGAYLSIAFSGDQVTDFDLDGTISDTWFFNGGRGVYRLGNGNLLLTAGDGVWEMDPATGNLIENKNPDASARFIEYIVPAPSTMALFGLGALTLRRRR